MKLRTWIVIFSIIGVVLGVALQRYVLSKGEAGMAMPAASAPAKKILYYRHPMTPSITADRPLKDDMGMDYIPVYEDEEGEQSIGDNGVVSIAPNVINNMGVRIASVERSVLPRHINTVGYISYDQDKIHHVHLRTEGWIENLRVKFAGERVHKNDLLFETYSPKLVTAQQEYIQALNTGNKFLLNASRTRLSALGVADAQISRLEKTRQVEQLIKTYASQDGVVAELAVREGMFVEPDLQIMSIVNFSSVWVLADIFEQQAAWVAAGQETEMQLSYYPGKVWKGRLEYVYPDVDQKTRTLKVRLRFANADELLKPNMYADVSVLTGDAKPVLAIPREALIRTGGQQRVIVALGEGKFAPREVKAGSESGDHVEILEGLQEGEQVVASGQFLIDSESSLKASLQRITSGDTAASSATESTDQAKPPAIGIGVVNKLHDNKINISHEPIASIKWPAMTMDFQLADPGLASGIQSGSKVEFEFSEAQGGAFVISRLNPLKAAP